MDKSKIYTLDEVLGTIDRAADAVGGQKWLAEDMGVSAEYLSSIITGKRLPQGKVLDFLGLKKVIVFAPKEEEE